MLNGEELHIAGSDNVVVNPDTGVLTVHGQDRHGEFTTHYSPAAWRSVTQRIKRGRTGAD